MNKVWTKSFPSKSLSFHLDVLKEKELFYLKRLKKSCKDLRADSEVARYDIEFWYIDWLRLGYVLSFRHRFNNRAAAEVHLETIRIHSNLKEVCPLWYEPCHACILTNLRAHVKLDVVPFDLNTHIRSSIGPRRKELSIISYRQI